MGDVKRVAITGASGFIGRATIATAVQAGLEVVAVQRSAVALGAGVTPVAIDLGSDAAVPALVGALERVDAVIHLAAAMSGDATDHARLTVGGTKRVIEAMQKAGIGHLTLASSLAVYDTTQVPIGDAVTETTPLVAPAKARDVYSAAKVGQETLARAAELCSVAILRPGIVYDADHLWNAHLGVGLGPVLFQAGATDPLPMCHVKRCAAALVQASVHQIDDTFTLVDPMLPTRGAVVSALQQTGWPKLVLPLPCQVLWAGARMLSPAASFLPGLLRAPVLRQRLMPITYAFNPPSDLALPDPSPNWGDTT